MKVTLQTAVGVSMEMDFFPQPLPHFFSTSVFFCAVREQDNSIPHISHSDNSVLGQQGVESLSERFRGQYRVSTITALTRLFSKITTVNCLDDTFYL